MAKKEKFVRTGQHDEKTGCEWVEIEVTVGKDANGKPKKFTAHKRLFEDGDQLGGVPEDEVLKMVNYAEDLFVRAATTRLHTDIAGKQAKRDAARLAWAQEDKAALAEFVVSHTLAEFNAKLEEYYDENLATD